MSDQRFRIETRVGRLIEARVFSLRTRGEVEAYGKELLVELSARPPSAPSPVLCADHRPVAIYAQEATDVLVEMFRPNNSRFERIAIVAAPTNAILLLQLERMARQAGFEKRKVFKESAGALTHLAPGLNAGELARARAFLAEVP